MTTDEAPTGLILTVGMTHEPIVYSLRQLQPGFVAYLSTPGSRATLDRVHQEFSMPPSRVRMASVEDTPTSIGKLVHEFHRAYLWMRDECHIPEKQIFADPTAGRKWMSAGATMIASFLGLEMFYTDVQFSQGAPQPETMHLVQLGNAYAQTGFLEAEKGRELFNRCDYASAAAVYCRLAPALSDTNDLYRGLASLSTTLHKWDLFRHYEKESLSGDFEEAFASLERYVHSAASPTAFRHFVADMRRLAEAIGEIHRSTKPTLLATVDLVANAHRRIARGRYDDAMARLYRALESLSQFYLKTCYGIDTDDRNWSQSVDAEKLEAIETRLRRDDLQSKISLKNGWLILWELGCPAAKHVFQPGRAGKLTNKFEGLLDRRNSSILAHGWMPVTKDSAERMYQKMVDLLQACEPQQAPAAFARLAVPQMPPFFARQGQ